MEVDEELDRAAVEQAGIEDMKRAQQAVDFRQIGRVDLREELRRRDGSLPRLARTRPSKAASNRSPLASSPKIG